MLFDLKSGKRRRVVQVVFGFLAFIFFISFVGFGIGSGVSGGMFDAIGLGGDDSSARAPNTSRRSRTPRRSSSRIPTTSPALLELAGACYRSATESGVTIDPQTGGRDDQRLRTTSSSSRSPPGSAIWRRSQSEPRLTAAAQAAEAYRFLLDAEGAPPRRSAIVAEAQEPSAAFYQLALYLYADGQLEAGDGRRRRRSRRPSPGQRASVARRSSSSASRPESRASSSPSSRRSSRRAQPGRGSQDPFGGLSGGGSGARTGALIWAKRLDLRQLPSRPRAVSSAGRAGDS